MYQFVSVSSNMEQDIKNYERWYTAARFLWIVRMKYYEDTNTQLLKSFSYEAQKVIITIFCIYTTTHHHTQWSLEHSKLAKHPF